MTGDGISKTITDTTTGLTVSEHHGTGADTTAHIGVHGDIVHGTTAAGTALGTAADGTTAGITEDGTTHGIMVTTDGMEDGMTHGMATCIRTTQDGMEDGILTGVIITTTLLITDP